MTGKPRLGGAADRVRGGGLDLTLRRLPFEKEPADPVESTDSAESVDSAVSERVREGLGMIELALATSVICCKASEDHGMGSCDGSRGRMGEVENDAVESCVASVDTEVFRVKQELVEVYVVDGVDFAVSGPTSRKLSSVVYFAFFVLDRWGVLGAEDLPTERTDLKGSMSHPFSPFSSKLPLPSATKV